MCPFSVCEHVFHVFVLICVIVRVVCVSVCVCIGINVCEGEIPDSLQSSWVQPAALFSHDNKERPCCI